MADTEFATGAAETVKRWASKLWVEMPREIYWGKFMKENDMNAVIEVKRYLEGNPGDQLTFTLLRKLSGAGVSGGNATATTDIGSDDTATVAKIESMVAKAQKATPKIWPVRVEEGDFYVLCLHTDVGYDLRQSTQWIDASQEAGPRDYGKNNLFTGRLGIVGGVVVHAHEKIPSTTV